MTPEEILAKAADLLEMEGWCQGVAMNAVGHRCVSRALWDAAGLPIDAKGSAQWRIALMALEREIAPPDIIGYNDRRGRVKDEVVTALRNAKRWL